MLLYSLAFIFALFILLRIFPVFHLDHLSKWTLPIAFLLKIGAGLLLFYLHIETYGIGELSHDGETFLREGKYLNDVFYQSPKHYFQLLTGWGETNELIHKHLAMTQYWSAGDMTLINDSKNIIRFHSLIHFFSGNSVIIHLSVLCFISLMAIKMLYSAILPYVQLKNSIVFWFLLMVPSTIFWTSSLMKEPLLFFGIGLLVYSLLNIVQPFKKVLFSILACLILTAFKPYVLVCIVLSLSALFIYKRIFKQRFLLATLSMIAAIFVLGSLLEKPRKLIVHNLTRKQFDFVNVGKGGLHVIADTCLYYFQPHQYENVKFKGNAIQLIHPSDAYAMKFGSTQEPIPVHLTPSNEKWWTIAYFAPGCKSYIETTPIENSSLQLIKNIPEAFVNSSLRPFPNDPGSDLKYLSMFEVWGILLFIIFALFNRRKLNLKEKEIVFSLGVFALFLFLLIGWTTPVIGAITRYRFPAQLALIVIGLIIVQPPKFLRND